MTRPLALAARVAAAASLSATTALAQEAPLPPARDTVPACADQGIRRVAVMVPPDRTRDELRAMLASGSLFPAGTEAVILAPGQIAPLRNTEEFRRRLDQTVHRFLRDGTRIDGSLSVLLVLDATGAVTEAHPNTSNKSVYRTLATTWKHARFEPYEHDGCRMQAWIDVPLTFSSEWDVEARRIQVRTGPPPP